MMLVAVQLSVPGLYLPPVFRNSRCRQIHPRRSFHCRSRLPCDKLVQSGALVVLVAVQLSVLGLYLPPVFRIADSHQIHPRRSFHCRSTLPCDYSGIGRVGQCWWRSNYPCWDCICRRCSNRLIAVTVRPRRSFHCQSTLPCDLSGIRRATGGCPGIVDARRLHPMSSGAYS